MASLQITVAGVEGHPVDVQVSPFVIGREADCDLVVDDPRASRRHAQLEVQPDGRVVLRDLASANGTFVDDTRIEGGIWFVVPGSFRVGRTTIAVRRTSDAGETVIVPAGSDATVIAANPMAAAPVVAATAAAPAAQVPYASPAPAATLAPAAIGAAAVAAQPGVLWAPVDAETSAPGRFRSSRTRGTVAMIAIGLVGILDVVSIAHLVTFGQLADDIVSGAATTADAQAFDDTTAVITGAFILVLLFAGIAYLAWLSRAVENAPAIGAGTPPRSPRGAIGWWFVPFANFVVPYQIVSDLHDRLAGAMNADPARPLLLGWWLTWLGGNLIGYATRFSGGDTIDQLKSTITVTMISDTLNVVSAILAILVIRRIVLREDARAATAREVGSGAPGV